MLEFFGTQWLPLFWLILAIVLGVVEAASVQLMAIWFAVGAVVSIIPAVMGASLPVQFIVFLAVSTILLIATRPFAKKFLNVKKKDQLGQSHRKSGRCRPQNRQHDGGRPRACLRA